MISTILITDDNILDNVIIRDYLYKERYNLLSALNGREALDLIEGRKIDLILLDLVMPVMDGLEFLKCFSKTHFYNEIPIIIISSQDDEETIEKVMCYNIFDFVVKPIQKINRAIIINKIHTGISYRKLLLDALKVRQTFSIS